jgi:hypothetical protein
MSTLFLFFTESVSVVIRQTCICIPQVSMYYLQDVHDLFVNISIPLARKEESQYILYLTLWFI